MCATVEGRCLEYLVCITLAIAEKLRGQYAGSWNVLISKTMAQSDSGYYFCAIPGSDIRLKCDVYTFTVFLSNQEINSNGKKKVALLLLVSPVFVPSCIFRSQDLVNIHIFFFILGVFHKLC